MTEPIQETILATMVTQLQTIKATSVPAPWYVPKFITRTYRLMDEVNEFPGYIVLDAGEESFAEAQDTDHDGTILGTMGVEVLAYGQGTDTDPADRVLIRLLAQAERVLVNVLPLTAPWLSIDNTRRVIDHETEVGAPWRSLKGELYRLRYLYTRGAP